MNFLNFFIDSGSLGWFNKKQLDELALIVKTIVRHATNAGNIFFDHLKKRFTSSPPSIY